MEGTTWIVRPMEAKLSYGSLRLLEGLFSQQWLEQFSSQLSSRKKTGSVSSLRLLPKYHLLPEVG